MKLSAILSLLIGLAALAALVMINGPATIVAGVAAAGWGILAVVVLHLPQILCSSYGVRAVIRSAKLPSITALFGIRLIREAANGLLPVAQIGGHVAAARLLAKTGLPLSAAGAAVTVDLTLEMLSQVGFTVLGVLLLAASPGALALPRVVPIATIAALAMLVVIFLGAQRFGLFRLVERVLLRLGQRYTWMRLADVAGLHGAIVSVYQSPRRLLIGLTFHCASWMLGSLEVLVALKVLDIDGGLGTAIIIESLGQAFRAVGFVVPGALGIQEGGVILVCGLLGISPQAAIELSLIRRIRELLLGLPALAGWYFIEGPLTPTLSRKRRGRRKAVMRTTAQRSLPERSLPGPTGETLS